MKRITSIILLIAMLSSVCALFSGCVDKFISVEMKQSYAKQFNIEDVKSSDILIEYHAGTYNGYTVAMLDASCHDFDEWKEEIGNSTIKYQDTNRLFAYKDGKFSTLTEAHASGALSDAEIAEIADKFNRDITVFYQICDKYDFDDSYEFSDPDLAPIELDYVTDYVIVIMQTKFSKVGEIPPKSYFGSDIIKSVIDTTPEFLDPEDDDYYIRLKLELYISSKANVRYVENRLRKVPGIREVSVDGTLILADTYPNDTNYRNSEQWGLSDINVEKVWDYSTGTNAIKVGIIDTGLGYHNDLINNTNNALSYDLVNDD